MWYCFNCIIIKDKGIKQDLFELLVVCLLNCYVCVCVFMLFHVISCGFTCFHFALFDCVIVAVFVFVFAVFLPRILL